MKIAIFGGSFDPIHNGHVSIIKYAFDYLNLDKLILVPANINPFKKTMPTLGLHRINMLKIATEGIENVEVSDFEIKRKFKSYTIDTISYFKNIYKNDELFLLIGSDNLAKLAQWKKINEIEKLAKIVIFKRTNNFSKINLKKFNCLLVNNFIFEGKSTEYKKGNFDFINHEVQKYIGNNFLYFDDIARQNLSHKRYAHLKYTANFAIDLAKHLVPKDKQFHIKAYQAGYMHDITKEWDNERSYLFLEKYIGNARNKILEHELHQNTAYYFLKDIYKYPHQDVLNAIKIHTTLNHELTLLDKILFVADKICEGRKFKGVQELRKLVFEDFEEGFAKVVKICAIDFNLNKNVTFTKEQKEIYYKWAKI